MKIIVANYLKKKENFKFIENSVIKIKVIRCVKYTLRIYYSVILQKYPI